MATNDKYQIMQQFVRLSLNHDIDTFTLTHVDWKELFKFTAEQGLLGIAFDGVEKLPNDMMPEKTVMLKYFGQVHFMKQMYLSYENTLFRFAQLLSKHHINVLLMKGYGLSLNYPKPELRSLGDMDIYPFYDDGSSGYNEVNCIIEAMNIKVDYSHHKQSVFYLDKVMVECHHSFLNAKVHKSSAQIENMLKHCINPIFI